MQKDNQNGDKQRQILEAAIEEFTYKVMKRPQPMKLLKRQGFPKASFSIILVIKKIFFCRLSIWFLPKLILYFTKS